ncbi:hypothetical protein, unlikely [Trypanosoma congolense IL3000]|uniref:Uncharacterized protein n=1 Tax=Trypanosoma congolense (strain IL3000) TaxID=1068625 RepID=F9WD10_TRYCI|nr:hypothetical protein, unlikely [Trypanosoma congolense IL3000]
MNCCGIFRGRETLVYERVVYYQRIIEQSSLTTKSNSHDKDMAHPLPIINPFSESVVHSPLTHFPLLLGDKKSPSINLFSWENNFKLTLRDNHREVNFGGRYW